MPRKKKAAPDQTPSPPEPAETLVPMVACRHGFKCAAHEGDISGEADFTTTETRATLLESRNLAARKG